MIPQLIPPAERKIVRRRWSFRFGGLGLVTSALVGVWKFTPDAWHPILPEWSKYLVMGIAGAFALLSQASHQFEQPSLSQPQPPAGNDFHQGGAP
jgi:hypothetical protein